MDDTELISNGELKNNGGYRVEDVNDKLYEEINIRGTAVVSPSVTVVPLEGTGSSSSLLDKRRQELKKWRRIPRELVKKTGSNGSPVQPLMFNVNGDHLVQHDNLVAVLPDDHQRNGRIGSVKKSRGGFKIEKEDSNSNSTIGILGSDSGRSDFVFVQGGNIVAKSGSFAERDEESSDDKDLNEESEVVFIKSDAESDDVSVEHDLLVESIKGLHSAQEEFEREVQKWRDVGKDDPLMYKDPICEILELKDAKILELESALSSVGIKTELEDHLMKTIQADVENVVITTATKQLTEGPLRETKHRLQQKNEALQGVQAADGRMETKESLKNLKHRVCRFTSCFMIQMVLLFVTLYLKLSPQDVEFVPT